MELVQLFNEGEAGAIYAPRRPEGYGTKASRALATRSARYGQPFSGLRERAQKMAAVASHWQKCKTLKHIIVNRRQMPSVNSVATPGGRSPAGQGIG